MPLIASTVFHQGKIHGEIVYCTEEEYKLYTMHDKINENQVSVTFLKDYLEKAGINLDALIKENEKPAFAGSERILWLHARTVTIPSLKVIIEDARLDFHAFIDAYCDYLKNL